MFSDMSLICDKGVTTQNLAFFCFIGIETKVGRCTFNRYSVITQFAKLAAGEQLCRRCTHRKLQHFKTFNTLNAELNPLCYLLALLGAHYFLHVSRIINP